MNRDLTDSEKQSLEALIDGASLGAVLMALSEICGEKAEHIRENWQDAKTAKVWDTAGGAIGLLVCSKAIALLNR